MANSARHLRHTSRYSTSAATSRLPRPPRKRGGHAAALVGSCQRVRPHFRGVDHPKRPGGLPPAGASSFSGERYPAPHRRAFGADDAGSLFLGDLRLLVRKARFSVAVHNEHDLQAIAEIHAHAPLDLETLLGRFQDEMSPIGDPVRIRGNVLAVVELVFGIYFSFVCAVAWQFEMFASLPFLALFPIGFFYVSGLSFAQTFAAKPKVAVVPMPAPRQAEKLRA